MFSKVSTMHQEVVLACFEVVSASYWVSGKADHPDPSGQCMGPVGQFFENFRFLQKCPKRSQVVSKVSKIHQKVGLACFEFVSASYWVSDKANHPVPPGQCMEPVGQFFENFRFL